MHVEFDKTHCYINQPFEYEYGQPFNITGIDTSQANQILKFSVKPDSGVKISEIPPELWIQFPYLEQLELTGVVFQLVNPIDFENAWNLYNLSITYNTNIDIIPSMVFSRATKLTEIDLQANGLDRIEDFAFNGLYSLYVLKLGRNDLITLTSNTFFGAPHLTELYLDHNSIQTLEPGVFELPDLMFLDLGNNPLKALPNDCFRFTQLIALNLEYNSDLEEVGNATYTPSTLRILNLAHNGKIRDLNLTRIKNDLPRLDWQVGFKYDTSLKTLS